MSVKKLEEHILESGTPSPCYS